MPDPTHKPLEVVPYTPELRERWDAFVAKSNNGTMFHQQRFLDYHPEGRFPFHHLLFMDSGNIVAVLPGQLREGIYRSPSGASYGGFAVGDVSLGVTHSVVQSFLAYARANGIREVSLTSAPLVYQHRLNFNLEFCLLYAGFQYTTHLFSSVIALNPAMGDPLDTFSSMARRAVKKSQADSIRVEINEDYDAFYPILVENKRKFNLPPTHTLDELKALRILCGDQLKLFMAYLDDVPIGGVLLFEVHPRCVLAFYIAHLYEYQRHRAVNNLFYECIKWSALQGYDWLDLGVSMNTAADSPMEPSWTLISFKESVDSRGFLRSTLHKILD